MLPIEDKSYVEVSMLVNQLYAADTVKSRAQSLNQIENHLTYRLGASMRGGGKKKENQLDAGATSRWARSVQ